MKLNQLAQNDDLLNFEEKYPLVGDMVDGLEVTSNIDNLSSIKASLDEYTILHGIRQVPMIVFGGPKSVFYAKDDFDRSRELAKEIERSGKISPLIIVIDSEGPYILEGSHRYVALYYLNKTYLPALIVIDKSEE